MTEINSVNRTDSQLRREANRVNSAAVLTKVGLKFTSHNYGAHLIITVGDTVVDFWPGTGKYVVRGGATGRGVFNLLRLLKPLE